MREHQHRVLTEDVKFLRRRRARARARSGQRRVVAAFAAAMARVRPDLGAAQLHKPLAMLLFGMINWTFTWLSPGGALTHDTLAPMVVELFFGGLPAVSPPPVAATQAPRAGDRRRAVPERWSRSTPSWSVPAWSAWRSRGRWPGPAARS